MPTISGLPKDFDGTTDLTFGQLIVEFYGETARPDGSNVRLVGHDVYEIKDMDGSLVLDEGAYKFTFITKRTDPGAGHRAAFDTQVYAWDLTEDTTWATIHIQGSGIPGEITGTAAALVAELEAIRDEAVELTGLDTVEAAVEAAMVPLRDMTPTLEELTVTVNLGGDITAARTVPIHVAPYSSELNSLALVVADAVSASDTNYWTVTIKRYRAGVEANVGIKTTKFTGGQALAAFVPWDYGTVVLANTGLIPGDVLVLDFAPTGSPAPLVDPVVTFGPPPAFVVSAPMPGDVLRIEDTFTRADSTTSLGTTSDGNYTWVYDGANVGLYGISSNQAYSASTGSKRAWVNAARSDVRVQCKVGTVGATGTWGLVLRYQDFNNHYGVSQVSFFKNIAGATTQLVAWTVPLVAGDTVAIDLVGNTWAAYVDRGTTGTFVLEGTGTDSTYPDGFLHGLRSTGNGHRWDDFRIYA